MKTKKVIEGEIFRIGGAEPEYGDSLRVIVADGAMSFKDEIVIIGEGGFKGYPSEELFLELGDTLEKKNNLVGVITEIKKEGTYCAIFRVD